MVYLVLGLGALAGVYDVLIGLPATWVYGQAIDYSDRSVINSLIALGVVQAAKWVSIILPPLSAVRSTRFRDWYCFLPNFVHHRRYQPRLLFAGFD